MKAVAKLVSVLGLMLSFSAVAVDTGPRKEAILDTGKGGLRMVVSAPGTFNGPIDFAGNKGPAKIDDPDWKYREVAFNAQVGETGFAVYMANMHWTPANKPGKRITAEFLASEMLGSAGFSAARATKVEDPRVPFDGATVVTYKVTGYAILNGKERRDRGSAIIVSAVTLPGNLQGYAMMAQVGDKPDVFDAAPAKYEKAALKLFGDLYKNHEVAKN